MTRKSNSFLQVSSFSHEVSSTVDVAVYGQYNCNHPVQLQQYTKHLIDPDLAAICTWQFLLQLIVMPLISNQTLFTPSTPDYQDIHHYFAQVDCWSSVDPIWYVLVGNIRCNSAVCGKHPLSLEKRKHPVVGQQSLTRCPQRQKEQDFRRNWGQCNARSCDESEFSLKSLISTLFTVPPSSLVLTSTNSATEDLIILTCLATEAFPAPSLSLAWTER